MTLLTNHCPSVSWQCCLGHLTCEIIPEMSRNVSSGTLNSTIPDIPKSPYWSRATCRTFWLLCLGPQKVNSHIHFVSLAGHVSTHLLIHLSADLCHHHHSHHPSLLHSFTPGSKPTFSTNPSHPKYFFYPGLPSRSRNQTRLNVLVELFIARFFSFIFCLFRVVD